MTPRRQHEIDTARAFAEKALAQGFRAFIAEKGNYGFFTDTDGERVVCFQVNGYFESSASGNYVTNNPAKTGTGWQLGNGLDREPRDLIKCEPPYWAVRDAEWRYATLEDQLNRYNASSKYIELTA